MLLYESNYLKFARLAGQLDPAASRWISRVTSDNDLHLERTLAEPYTTTFKMTYWLRDAHGVVVRDPDLTVRIYHDAAQAEALSWRTQHHHEALRGFALRHAHELSQRWQRNMMLNKWLDYLLDRGHGFSG
jgi:hypothetical protein